MRLAHDLPLLLQARAWDCAAMFAWLQQDLQRAWELAEQALAAYRGAEDTDGEAWSLRQLGVIAEERGDLDEVGRAVRAGRGDVPRAGRAEGFADRGSRPGDLRAGTRRLRSRAGVARGEPRAISRARLRCRRRKRASSTSGSWRSMSAATTTLSRSSSRASESALRYGRRVNVLLSLRGLAASTAVSEDLVSAARMLGAAEAMEEQIGEEM